jgi:hypothetical protein
MNAYVCLIRLPQRSIPEMCVITCDELDEIPWALDRQLPWPSYERVDVYDGNCRVHVREAG